MHITDLLDKNCISLDASPKSKKDALDQIIELMMKSGNILDRDEFRAQVYRREEEGSTGIGHGLAVPHGKCNAVSSPTLAAMVVPKGVEFDSLDQNPVELIFLIAAPDTEENLHLKLLSKLSVLLMKNDFITKLKNAENVDEFLKIIDEAEEKNSNKKKIIQKTPKLLAVTSCPTGIAHTYMAAEGLEEAAKKHNVTIKVETRGSGGVKNLLIDEEIKEADCIIIAADIIVPMERFIGKRVLECQVTDGISKPDKLIQQALHGEVPLLEEESGRKPNINLWHRIYMHLMNGISHMLPFVVGGGLLIALAYMIDGLAIDIIHLSEGARSQFGSITPFARMLKGIGDLAFGLMLPMLSGYIAQSIADRPGFAPGVVGGMVAAGGKSGFMGALVAGFLAGYIVKFLRRLFDRDNSPLQRIAPVLLYPLLGIFFVGTLMELIIEPPVGIVNMDLHQFLRNMGNSSKIILGTVVASMMAIDMGGPFNKAAYVFGTASIASGEYDIMAAVMLGGMVPPCAIALSTILFPHKYSADERKSSPMNFIMGLSFVTEGAIPFAVADPLRVLPSCMIGAGVSGALSMFFGCTLMAPNGGIFVFPLADKTGLYFISLVAGTVVAALLLGILKKRVDDKNTGIKL